MSEMENKCDDSRCDRGECAECFALGDTVLELREALAAEKEAREKAEATLTAKEVLWRREVKLEENAHAETRAKLETVTSELAVIKDRTQCELLRHVCGGCGFRWPERSAYDELTLGLANEQADHVETRAKLEAAKKALRRFVGDSARHVFERKVCACPPNDDNEVCVFCAVREVFQ